MKILKGLAIYVKDPYVETKHFVKVVDDVGTIYNTFEEMKLLMDAIYDAGLFGSSCKPFLFIDTFEGE
jgi:hypothetical protein